jgi:hypothetical protein
MPFTAARHPLSSRGNAKGKLPHSRELLRWSGRVDAVPPQPSVQAVWDRRSSSPAGLAVPPAAVIHNNLRSRRNG